MNEKNNNYRNKKDKGNTQGRKELKKRKCRRSKQKKKRATRDIHIKGKKAKLQKKFGR